jgi:hypothetical protein
MILFMRPSCQSINTRRIIGEICITAATNSTRVSGQRNSVNSQICPSWKLYKLPHIPCSSFMSLRIRMYVGKAQTNLPFPGESKRIITRRRQASWRSTTNEYLLQDGHSISDCIWLPRTAVRQPGAKRNFKFRQHRVAAACSEYSASRKSIGSSCHGEARVRRRFVSYIGNSFDFDLHFSDACSDSDCVRCAPGSGERAACVVKGC